MIGPTVTKPIIKCDGWTITLVNRAEVLASLQAQIRELLRRLKR